MSACDQWFINMIACVSNMQWLSNVDPGPAVRTQLTQQPAHQSTALQRCLPPIRYIVVLNFKHFEIVSFSFCMVLWLFVNRCWKWYHFSFGLGRILFNPNKILHRFNWAWSVHRHFMGQYPNLDWLIDPKNHCLSLILLNLNNDFLY